MENNKLIAEFMNLSQCEEGWITIPYENRDSVSEDEISLNLEYHSSWDWLMPVVEKISDIKSWSINATLEWLSESQNRDGLYTKEDVYESVVEFIKQLNK